MSSPAEAVLVAPAAALPMDEQDGDFGYHPVGTTPETLEQVRSRPAHALFSHTVHRTASAARPALSPIS